VVVVVLGVADVVVVLGVADVVALWPRGPATPTDRTSPWPVTGGDSIMVRAGTDGPVRTANARGSAEPSAESPGRPRVSVPAGVGLALAAGLAWALAAPPRGWWPLLPLGVAALTVALHGRRLRARLLLGGLTGLAVYAPTLWWLTDFAVPGWVAVVVLETALLTVAAGLVPAAHPGPWSGGGWWGLPAALVLLEAAQTRIPFGGFPLPTLALSQPGGPFAVAAPLGGSLLVTALAATSGVALAALILVSGRVRRLAAAGTAAALAAAPLAVGAAVATTPAGTLDAALVQGGGPRGLRAVFTDPGATTERHLTVAEQINGSPDLVLLPENVVSVDGPIAGSDIDERLAALARELDAPVVVGITEADRGGFRNAAVLWGPEGQRLDRYEKEHRVPFGEYIPGRDLLERVTDLTALVPRDAITGEGQAGLRPAAGPPLAVVISYEVFFADRVREGVTAGGQVVLVPTNAASYVSDEVPAAEVAAARLRAMEFGRTVLQAAPTGYSAVILLTGEVAAQSRLGTPALLREEVPLRTGLTPYARVGDLPLVALAGLSILAPTLAPPRYSRLVQRNLGRRGGGRHFG
jgi:apolipoprotein N-acyltransferase